MNDWQDAVMSNDEIGVVVANEAKRLKAQGKLITPLARLRAVARAQLREY